MCGVSESNQLVRQSHLDMNPAASNSAPEIVVPNQAGAEPAMEIVKEGFLLKKGDFTQKWRQRYFVLRSNPCRLDYYSSPQEQIRGSLAIDQLSLVSLHPKKSKKFRSVFSLRIRDSKLVILAHERQDEVDSWIIAIESLMSPSMRRFRSSLSDFPALNSDASVLIDNSSFMARSFRVKAHQSAVSAPVSREVSPFPFTLGQKNQMTLTRENSPVFKEAFHLDDLPYENAYWDTLGCSPRQEIRKIINETLDQARSLNDWNLIGMKNSTRILKFNKNPFKLRVSTFFPSVRAESLFLFLKVGFAHSKFRKAWDIDCLSAKTVAKYGSQTDVIELTTVDPFILSSTKKRETILRHWFIDRSARAGLNNSNEETQNIVLVYKAITLPLERSQEVLERNSHSRSGGFIIIPKLNGCLLIHSSELSFTPVSGFQSALRKVLESYCRFFSTRFAEILANEIQAFKDYVFDISVNEHVLKSFELETINQDEESFNEISDYQRSDSVTEDLNSFPCGVKDFLRSPEGGMIYTDQEEVSKQRWVAQDILKSMGSNLMQGKSLTSISMPVKVFEPRSFLQRMPDLWVFAPIFLTRAAKCDDPVLRFKNTMVFILSGLHRGMTQQKPFNPILGETFQCCFSDGTNIYLEQISHHPPISAFELFGPQSFWKMSGYHEYSPSLGMNHAQGAQDGPNNVTFRDGGHISFQMPPVMIKGIVWGDRHVYWTKKMVFQDEKNGLSCEIQFGPSKKSGWFNGSAKDFELDKISGTIMKKVSDSQTAICSVSGSWLDTIYFDDVLFWKMNELQPYCIIPIEDSLCLPSDSRHREDLKLLKLGDMDAASSWKVKLEEAQRRDRKLRKDYGPIKTKSR